MDGGTSWTYYRAVDNGLMEMGGGGARLRCKGQNSETPKAETINTIPAFSIVIYKHKDIANVRIT